MRVCLNVFIGDLVCVWGRVCPCMYARVRVHYVYTGMHIARIFYVHKMYLVQKLYQNMI